MNKHLEAYYKEIYSLIVCEGKQKKVFIKEFQSAVCEYTELNPACTIEDIRAVFGTPEEIAFSFIENGNFTKVKKKLDVKRVIIAAVITALLIWFAFAVISLIDVHQEAHGTLTEGMLIINAVTEGKL